MPNGTMHDRKIFAGKRRSVSKQRQVLRHPVKQVFLAWATDQQASAAESATQPRSSRAERDGMRAIAYDRASRDVRE